MGTQMKKKTYPVISQESIMLANRARSEQLETGQISVVCPKCQEHPRIFTTSKGERTIIECKCRYIQNAEINF